MTRPTLTVVGKGAVPDASADDIARAEEVARKIVEAAKAGKSWFALIDADDIEVAWHGDALELAALTEEMARSLKLSALGLE